MIRLSLKQMIRECGLRQTDFAQIVGCDQSMISYVHRGGRPSYAMAQRIVRALARLNPRMEIPAHLWMLRLGFVPDALRTANEKRQVECLVRAGVVGEVRS